MAAAKALMAELEEAQTRGLEGRGGGPGKMYGVLLGVDAAYPGRGTVTLKAFSGRLRGALRAPGWAPPVPEADIEEEERRAFVEIVAIQGRLAEIAQDPVYVEVQEIERRHEAAIRALNVEAARVRAERGRCWAGDPSDGRRELRARRRRALEPWRGRHEELMREVAECKRRRREVSHALHKQIRASYLLPNQAGDTLAVEDRFSGLSPGGAGDCCAPKLLAEAARRGLRPLGMAEFWWGSTSPDGSKVEGEFYGPCAERCQPLLGHLLCDGGLSVVYRDDHLMAIDKPAGLGSVPGAGRAAHDSVQARVRLRFPGARVAHRLDVDTSGLLLVALDRVALAGLSAAFRRQAVDKRYVALLEAPPDPPSGLVELRTAPDPDALPRHRPDPTGKLGRTRFEAIDGARVSFEPLTGRTHQIRLAASIGLGRPIVGDRLYGPTSEASGLGSVTAAERLMLHATRLTLRHPVTAEVLDLESPPPF